MKQNLRLFMLTLLCAVFSSAWGQQVAYTFQTAKNQSYSDYTQTYDVVIDGLTWNVPGNHVDDGVLRIGGKSLTNVDRVITGKSPISDKIISIKVNHSGTTSDKLIVNSFTVTVASDANFANVIETKTVTPTITKNVAGNFEITPNSNWPAESFYKFTINISNSQASNYAWVLNTIEFFKEGNADPIDPSVTLENTEVTVGRTLTISKPSDLTTTCTSSNESAATVTNDGVITAIQEGTTIITVNWAATDKYNSGSKTFIVTVLSVFMSESVFSVDGCFSTNSGVAPNTRPKKLVSFKFVMIISFLTISKMKIIRTIKIIIAIESPLLFFSFFLVAILLLSA